jgi:uncharacterized surface protein with fasciclin (FAS1) repeats
MQFKHLSLLGLASYALAQNDTGSLNSTLSSNSDLSNLTSILSANPALLQALGSAQNITILAPSNEAFAQLMNSSGAEALTDADLVSALLQYHILNGSYSADQITNSSVFVPTLLTNETYSNVTGGQVVQAVKIGNETVFYSGLLQNSTVTTAVRCFNPQPEHQMLNLFPGCELHRRHDPCR